VSYRSKTLALSALFAAALPAAPARAEGETREAAQAQSSESSSPASSRSSIASAQVSVRIMKPVALMRPASLEALKREMQKRSVSVSTVIDEAAGHIIHTVDFP